ncbi:unnamed protein product [Linum tenue]|uniref:Receptor-like serine/threonine-protein kinase n=1 Tax=Linum tenue TaxID=586396 RepID=A0AAV0PAU6_9ROSI|nr:unnamed protein product [Linum tenue]
MDLAEGLIISLLLQLTISLHLCSSSTDTLNFNESLADGQVLVSNGESYTLGFFSPGNSSNRYLGIWYTKVSVQTVVWVANRDNPINDASGSLLIDTRGAVVLQRARRNSTPLWSTNVSAEGNFTAKLLDEGNFILVRPDGKTVIWQSFDHLTDTIFPNMKFGLDRRTGLNRSIRSWKSPDDPAMGDWSYYLDPTGVPQMILQNGRTKRVRFGPWNGIRWNGVHETSTTFKFNTIVVDVDSETTVVWKIQNPAVISRMYVDSSGFTKLATWQDQDRRWIDFGSAPKDPCDYYGRCGPNGNCDPFNAGELECRCLPGFQPKDPDSWYVRDGSGGCVRKRSGNSTCGNGEGFVKLENAKIPDTSFGRLNDGVDLDICERECLMNCSCMAYASSNLTSGVGCVTFYGDLMDTRVFADGGQDLYVRVDAIELGTKGDTNHITLGTEYDDEKENLYEDKESHVQIFDVNGIFAATKQFSLANKLGQGGFGSVYKGLLSDGREVAVKRLSRTSRQGVQEFKNEVRLVSKLQHKNLARLLGCCIHGEEKMLVYEYLPNKSLDFFIFDKTKGSLLDWKKRFDIIIGIARGLMYLHQDSRLKIIHRDLKPSNILLDAAMNPKISDFGMARLFGEDQTEANTIRVVGTYGYLSPEYAMKGLYSTKSDVFSFGLGSCPAGVGTLLARELPRTESPRQLVPGSPPSCTAGPSGSGDARFVPLPADPDRPGAATPPSAAVPPPPAGTTAAEPSPPAPPAPSPADEPAPPVAPPPPPPARPKTSATIAFSSPMASHTLCDSTSRARACGTYGEKEEHWR